MKKLSLKQSPVIKTRLRLKYALVAVGGVGIAAVTILFLITGNVMHSEKAVAAPGFHGSKVISTTNVIVNEFTTLISDAVAGDKQLNIASSVLNSNGRFSAPLAQGELVMVVQMQGATINSAATGMKVIGTQTTTSTTGSPYRSGSGKDMKVQYLFTAAELLAAGVPAGNITSLSFNVTALGSGTLSGWTIKMGHTPALTIPATFDGSALTTVYTPLWGGIDAVLGWNAHNFTTPFNWNGVSNVIVQICHSNSSGSLSTVAEGTVANKTTYYEGANACSAASGTTYATRPIVTFGYPVNNALWGAVTAYNNAGNFEFVEIDKIQTATQIRFLTGLKYNYSAAGKVQIIRVPRYSTLTINAGASLTTQAWNGSTGGILAMEVNGNATINGAINVNGLGFRGGAPDNSSTENPRGNYYASASLNNYDGGEKGEGIAGSQTDYTSLGGRYGRGAAANGGGGGDSHNAAGGGGANGGVPASWDGLGNPSTSTASWANAWNLESAGFSTHASSGGGRGGYTYSQNLLNPLTVAPGNSTWGGDSRYNVGGLGGRPLTYSAGKIFLGGGGGAGDGDDSKSTGGGDGGGIVFLITDANVSGTGSISANGEDALASTGPTPKDAAGGGGGGGAVFIYRTTGTISGITINAKGGAGGNQNDTGTFTGEAEGPGGGGGGGYISYTTPGAPVTDVSGGANGIANTSAMSSFPADGATRGGAGTVTTNPVIPYNVMAPLPVEFIKFEGVNKDSKIHLNWSTAAEVNNDYFTLERSADGKQFSELAKVTGAGSTTTLHTYSYDDAQPLSGISYYRLTQTDFNGQHETLKVISVSVEAENSLSALHVSPNPFSDSFNAIFESAEKEEIQVSIFNMNGIMVYSEKIYTEQGRNNYRFSAPYNFIQGTYILRLSGRKTVLSSSKIIYRKN